MEHEEIIAMALEEGLSFVPDANSSLAQIVRKAVAKEREACAVMLEARGKALCDSAGSDREQFAGGCEADNCADLIRARGQKEGA